jgi:CheY-like chemotaxis protein
MTKIMLVEDDNGLREIYEARLAAEGFDIVAAVDGEAALALAAKEKPDLVISDVMMPKISGFEMLDILRNTEGLKNVKIIMLTALGQAEDKTRADSLGADRYLVKSQVTLEDIVKATHDLLDPPTATASPAVSGTAATPVSPLAAAPIATPQPAMQTIAVAAPPASGDTSAPPAVSPAPVTPVAPPPVPAAEPVTNDPVNPVAASVISSPAVPVPVEPALTPVVETPVFSAPTPGSITAVEIPPEVTAPSPAPIVPTTQTSESSPVIAAPAQSPTQVLDTTDYAPKSLAEEEAIMQAQIDNFVSSADGGAVPATPLAAPAAVAMPAPVATEVAPSAEPAPQETTFSPMTDSGTSTEIEAPAPSPVPATPVDPNNDSAPVAHKKIIQPLNTTAKPDINALLAIEEAKEAASSAAAPVAPVTRVAPPPVLDEAPSGAPPASPSAAANGPVDPNSIAL